MKFFVAILAVLFVGVWSFVHASYTPTQSDISVLGLVEQKVELISIDRLQRIEGKIDIVLSQLQLGTRNHYIISRIKSIVGEQIMTLENNSDVSDVVDDILNEETKPDFYVEIRREDHHALGDALLVKVCNKGGNDYEVPQNERIEQKFSIVASDKKFVDTISFGTPIASGTCNETVGRLSVASIQNYVESKPADHDFGYWNSYVKVTYEFDTTNVWKELDENNNSAEITVELK